MYKVYDQNRQYVPFSEISPNLISATISAEDKNFWQNQGVDFNGLVRAIGRTVLKGSLQGP